MTLELPLPHLYTRTPMTMPVHVRRGRRAGPSLFVCAAVHGDELNGVEIIRRVLRRRAVPLQQGGERTVCPDHALPLNIVVSRE